MSTFLTHWVPSTWHRGSVQSERAPWTHKWGEAVGKWIPLFLLTLVAPHLKLNPENGGKPEIHLLSKVWSLIKMSLQLNNEKHWKIWFNMRNLVWGAIQECVYSFYLEVFDFDMPSLEIYTRRKLSHEAGGVSRLHLLLANRLRSDLWNSCQSATSCSLPPLPDKWPHGMAWMFRLTLKNLFLNLFNCIILCVL